MSAATASRSTLVLGGSFESAGGVLRENAAAIDLRTGAPTAWDPRAGSDHPSGVHEIVAHPAAVVLDGEFTRVGGKARDGLAVVGPRSGKPTWTIPQGHYPPFAIRGNVLYVCTYPDGPEPVTRIVGVDIRTGRLTGWSATVAGGAEALIAGPSTLYAGVSNGETDRDLVRHYLVRIEIATRESTRWASEIDAAHGGGEISALALHEGTLYAGGLYDAVGGEKRDGLAAFDAKTGSLERWHPRLDGVGGFVTAIAVSGRTAYVGGTSELAAFDTRTGRRVLWNTTPLSEDSSVRDIVVTPRFVYVAGSAGLTRLRAANR